ncbi:zinc finger, CCHC-type containing protein [Tanacetum coccineum]|uniref:Zinc finger, CCHC-type containing protein n=1 Tax=Tanacetum coccineum TaxID=301880 RepID=A0ABQ5AF46_9ASTR
MSTSKLNDSILWHARLGHVYFKRMQDMSKDELILDFDIDTEKCKTCMLTKITKKSFQNVKRETEVLELIHSDLCDLHATPSLGNKKYFMTFIDDASRFCCVYILHTKDEALDNLKVFKTEVELQQKSLIKRFRTDRGGGYMDTLYFQSVGIIHDTTTPYTPQQNGISERKIRIQKEIVNSMLSYSGLNQWFGDEAMLTACYLSMRVPNKRNNITPYELSKRKHKRTGKQPVVDLDEDDEDDEMASRRSITRWSNNEEILLSESWIEHSQDANIGKDQHEDIYWNLIMSDFNSRTTTPPRTKNMMTEKWTRMHGDCQRFNGIYKHLNRKSGESDADFVENAKTAYIDRYAGGSTGRSQSESVSSLVSQDYRRKCDAAEKEYEAKREKELAIMQCKKLEFLMIDPSSLPAAKRAIIERKQAEIMRKYPDA